MADSASAIPPLLLGKHPPHLRRRRASSWYGQLVLVVFLVAQCLDGILTYVGVATFGLAMEGNPIIAALMAHLGHGLGLVSAKVTAAALGVCLHLCEIHSVVALLAGFYLTAAVAPWTLILFF